MAIQGGATRQFKVQVDGYNLLGIAEVKLPDINFKTMDLEGAGIMGTISQAIFGNVDSLEVEVTFNTISAPAFKLLDISGKLIEFKSEIVGFETTTHGATGEFMRIALRGTTKGLSLGSLKIGDMMKIPFKLEATYLELWMNGEQCYKIDKFNSIFEVAGKALFKKLDDYL